MSEAEQTVLSSSPFVPSHYSCPLSPWQRIFIVNCRYVLVQAISPETKGGLPSPRQG